MDERVGHISNIEAATPASLKVGISRTFNPTFLNIVANDPAVRPSLEGEDGPLDLSPAIQNVTNYALVSPRGGFVLIRHEPGRYEVHSLFLAGGGAIQAMLEAQEWMFTRTDCESIVSKVPDTNKRAKGFAIAGGLRTIFKRDGAEYVELNMMDWAMRSASLEAHGERFHALVGTEHPHDEAHERAVGAAVLMIERGQPAKGVSFYNRWARQAGYVPISLLSASPVVVDVVTAVMGMGTDGMEVLLRRAAS